MSDLDFDFESCNIDVEMEFSGENNITFSTDSDQMFEYMADLLTSLIDYVLDPEIIAEQAGVTLEELEQILELEGMTLDDFKTQMIESLKSESGFDVTDREALIESLQNELGDELTDVGTYTIDEYEIIPVFEDDENDEDENDEDEDDEDADNTVDKYIYEDGSIVMSTYDGEELLLSVTFEKQ